MRAQALGLMALTAVLAGGAAAQEAVSMDQIQPAARSGGETGALQLTPGGEGAFEPNQLGAHEMRPPPPSQLTDEGRSLKPARQLTVAPPTAEGPAPLSTPQEGRTGAIARVEGEDRCDPAKAGQRRDAACVRVIERRSAEFERPREPEPSPEARLLGMQSIADAAAPDARLAARRLAEGEVDGSQAAQAVAAGREQVRPESPDAVKPETLSPAAQAVIEALRQGVTSITLPPR